MALGGELSLWNPLLLDWLVWMRKARPEIAIHAQVGVPDQLIEQLRTGVLDIAVLYAPKLLPGFRVELLVEEQLVLVRTADRDGEPAGSKHYVYVDWGPLFAAQHDASSSAFGEPGLMVGLGPLGLSYILRAGGMGYFRRGAAAPYIETGQLEVVEGAPEFTYPGLCRLSGSKRGASRRAGGAARPEASCEMIVAPRREAKWLEGRIATD
ncbi:LysR family transcriptional regulator substrate-binding protein [Mesorhizobium silamurunense]|uniref:LysR family transcriptional regulator substrate-binding protein n=1 Tax=Mesorhizobium silamurunense TaxID=499528 RepID=UPI001AEE99B3|nr:LysR family transcriptional regulator substrate-binding protein [Mesorhizobium silamurunense]